jgi:DNA polymerase-3 subunit alpha
MAAQFNHLHVHSQYSLLDGAVKVKDLVKRVAAAGMNAVAVTDHGNMFGAITLYKAAKEAKVQAILGCELDVARGSTGTHGHHVPLLASTADGYKNLVWLVSRGHVKGGPVTVEEIAARSKGLVAMSGCLGGLVSQAILEEGEGRGREVLGALRDAFEPGSLYVELQDHGLPEQSVINEILVRLARDMELPLVATNDVHYAERSDAEAHLYLSCIKTGRSLEEAKERHHGSSEMYLKTPEEMALLFSAYPEAVKATLEITERCKVSLKLGEPMLPSFVVPPGYDTEGYFRHVAREGLDRRVKEFAAQGAPVDADAYRRRLELELDVIAKMNFAGYFLIVWDFIRFAKETGVPVGPGRGSGAGSIVAYAMRITDLDPIPYNLLFERFLNPERVSMPDFDIDFCMDRRDEVIAYVQRKYGETSVGQIATFAELKSKSVVKDVARCMGITPTEAQQIANLIPRKTPAETYTIAESLDVEPKLKALYERDPRIKELLDQARKLEGLTRHAGKHAAGIVISEGPLWDHVPVFKAETRAAPRGADAKDVRPETSALVTQYYKDDVEQAGLVKFDFLGLKTLTVLDIALRLVNARPDYVADGKTLDLGGIGKTLDLARIPIDDVATYKLLASGETKGVFQLESSGMQQLFKDLKPDGFEDVVAAVALYRPGPLGSGMVEDFVNRKHGRAQIASLHPLVDELLAPTYGVIVYQEQVMQIAQKLAGYTLGGADLLRRAMGKKKPEEMAKQKSVFLEGAKAKGVDEKEAERIFGLLEYFAGYGFNKSHSAAYALITYQTAWLKAHYPVELLCAILTSDKDRIDKVVRTIADARAMGVTVLPPDVNESDTDFKVVYTSPAGDKKPRRSQKGPQDPYGPEIRFGLGAVRGLGGAALEAVFEARQSGPFRDLFDLASRVDAKRVNKAVFEALVQCGAFDSTLEPRGVSRARAFASVDIALERSRAASRDREAGQTTLFGLFDAAPQQSNAAPTAGDYVECEPWDRRDLLVRERQALGFYVSGHPLERYLKGAAGLARLGASPIAECAGMDDWAQVKLAGMVEGYRERIFKDGGGKVAFFDLEDLTGRVAVKLRARDIELYGPVLNAGEPVLVTGKVSFPQRDSEAEDDSDAPREPTILVNEVHPLTTAVRADTRSIAIRVPAEKTRPADLTSLKRVLSDAKGSCPVTLYVSFADGREAVLSLGDAWRVDVGDTLLSGIERIFGQQLAELR